MSRKLGEGMATRLSGSSISDNANDQIQMRTILREMADFIALYETIEEKLVAREAALEEKLLMGEKLIAEQLAKIKTSFTSFQAIMSDSGAARWRIAAESALREGAEHIKVLQDSSFEVSQAFKEGYDRLEKITNTAVKNITDATNTFRAADFKEAAIEGSGQIKEISNTGIKRITKLIQTFHFKSFVASLFLTVFVVFLTGLYMNNEWPWEIHRQAAKERNAGQTLLAAWPRLTIAEQQNIINASKK